MATLFTTRGKHWNAVLQTQQVYNDMCMKFLQQESAKANSHRVIEFDRHGHTFSVKETIDHNQGLARQEYRVLIPDRWCECGQFQAYRMPCSHVIAACSHSHFDAFSLVSLIYKVETLLNVYNNSFPVVAMEAYWPEYDGEIVWHNDLMRRNKKGRPNSKRIRTEMDDTDKMQRKCSVCRQV
jgi:hypothetical protein